VIIYIGSGHVEIYFLIATSISDLFILNECRDSYLENFGIHGILDTGGKILETGRIFGELKKNFKNLKKTF
jgi:hypothetical protein